MMTLLKKLTAEGTENRENLCLLRALRGKKRGFFRGLNHEVRPLC